MVSFWQHCYSTNRPDGAFMPSFFYEKDVRFSHAKQKAACVILCNWVHYLEKGAFTETMLL